MFRERLACRLLCGKRVEKTLKTLLLQGGKAELHFTQLCGYSAATLRRKAEEVQTPLLSGTAELHFWQL